MAFQNSPGINVTEIDLTDSVPQTAVTAAGLIGNFSWGPLGSSDESTTVSTTKELKRTFGSPENSNYKSFFSGMNYLSYSQNLKVSRVFNADSSRNAVNGVTVTTSETLFSFINFIPEDDDSSNDYINGGVTLKSASWMGVDHVNLHSQPYEMGEFFQGNSPFIFGENYHLSDNGGEWDAGDILDTVGAVAINNEMSSMPPVSTWTGNYTHDFSGSTESFSLLKDLITVKLKSANLYQGRVTVDSDTVNSWTLDTNLNNKTELRFANAATLRITPTISGFTAAVSGVLDVPSDFTSIIFTSGFGLEAGSHNVAISSLNATTPASLTVTVSLNSTTGLNTIVATALATPGAGLDLSNLLFDFSSIDSVPAWTTVTGIEVTVPQRNTFNLPLDILDPNGDGSVEIWIDGLKKSSISEYNIIDDKIYFDTELYSGAGVLKQINLKSLSGVFETLTSTPVLIKNMDDVNSYTGDGVFVARYPGTGGNNITVQLIDKGNFEYQDNYLVPPVDMVFVDHDDIAVIITRNNTPNSKESPEVEIFQYLKKREDSVDNWVEKINRDSNIVWCLGIPNAYREDVSQRKGWKQSLVAGVVTYALLQTTTVESKEFILTGGVNGDLVLGDWIDEIDGGISAFTNKDESDISLVFSPGTPDMSSSDVTKLQSGLVNLASSRKDVVAVISPSFESTSSVENVVSFFDGVSNQSGSSVDLSYAFADSNYKYQYDVHSNIYRWVPLCGDIAGIMSRTDEDRDPWISPAGFNRGGIKNLTKLRLSHSKTDRDLLYKNSINPISSFRGQGTILYGDKTLTKRNSAFNRINVRRLFIVLQRLVTISSNQMLFEFNDDFTRGQFVSMIEPFLRDVQGRRGIYEYKVVCDSTNNTSFIIDSNQFVGDIYIKPSRSINFIQLNFVAVATGVEFNEIIGNF
jgi:hypothetical protein